MRAGSQIRQLVALLCFLACLVPGISSFLSAAAWGQEIFTSGNVAVSVSASGPAPSGLDQGQAPSEQPATGQEESRLRVSVGRAVDLAGNPSSAQRERFAGNSPTASFSSQPVLLIEASRLPLVMPLDDMRLTSGFGPRRAPMLGASRHHEGIDVGAPAGTPIVATGNARVTSAGRSGGYGLMVVLDHGGGLETRYAHMSRMAVSRGDEVSEGQVIGFVGSTGISTGPHLHYETRLNGRPVDPLDR